MVSRAERTMVGEWWWTVDRRLLAALGALMVAGLVFLMAGGPPVAERLGLSTFHFVNRQVIYLVPTVALSPGGLVPVAAPRAQAGALRLPGRHRPVLLALQFGPEIKGAHRWIMLGGFGIQPSEFVKPAFVVLAAWAFSEGARRRDMPGAFLALLLLPADHRAARPAARFRPDHAPDHRLVLACSSSPACTGSGCSASAGSASSASSPPTSSCRTCATASSASSTSPRATRFRSTPPWKPSPRAAGSARGRARAASSASCRTRTPTSSSR